VLFKIRAVTNQDPFKHDKVWLHRPGGGELTFTCRHSGFAEIKSSTDVSFIGCMLTLSALNRTSLLPTAHALKLQREGLTAPPTVSFLHAAASSVVSYPARRPHPSPLTPGTVSNTRGFTAPCILANHSPRILIFYQLIKRLASLSNRCNISGCQP